VVAQAIRVPELGAQPGPVDDPAAVIDIDPADGTGDFRSGYLGDEPSHPRTRVDEAAQRGADGILAYQLDEGAGVEIDHSRSSSPMAITASESEAPSSRGGSGFHPARPPGSLAGITSPSLSISAKARSAGETGMSLATTSPRRVISATSSASASSLMTLAA